MTHPSPRGVGGLVSSVLLPAVVAVDLNCNPIPGIPAVVQVIAVPGIIDIDIVVVVPIGCPVLWPRVKNAEPKAPVLKGGIPAKNHQRLAVDAERVTDAKITTEVVIWNPVAGVASALLPGAMFRLPVGCAMLLPNALALQPAAHVALVLRVGQPVAAPVPGPAVAAGRAAAVVWPDPAVAAGRAVAVVWLGPAAVAAGRAAAVWLVLLLLLLAALCLLLSLLLRCLLAALLLLSGLVLLLLLLLRLPAAEPAVAAGACC